MLLELLDRFCEVGIELVLDYRVLALGIPHGLLDIELAFYLVVILRAAEDICWLHYSSLLRAQETSHSLTSFELEGAAGQA